MCTSQDKFIFNESWKNGNDFNSWRIIKFQAGNLNKFKKYL